MAASDRQKERLQVPVMLAFRDAFEKRDAANGEGIWVDGERIIADRNSVRRGVAESMLKRDLGVDLASLVDTINLASSVDLGSLPYVAQSILNFGLPDLSGVTVGTDEIDVVGTNLRAALLRHEPRLNAKTLSVERDGNGDDPSQRVRFKVYAEMLSRPLDILVEFVAEVDIGAGKVHVQRLPGAS